MDVSQSYSIQSRLEAQGKNPFVLAIKEPDWADRPVDGLQRQSGAQRSRRRERLCSLMKENPEHSEELFAAAEQNAKWRLNGYKRMAAQTGFEVK